MCILTGYTISIKGRIKVIDDEIVHSLDVVDPVTNSKVKIIVQEINEPEIEEPDYTPVRLKMKIWDKAFKWVENKVIHSNTDMKLFNHIQEEADKINQIYISQTEWAKEYGVSRNKIATFLKKLIDIGFLHKKATGVYVMNPFVYCSARAWSGGNKPVIKLQSDWRFSAGNIIDLNEIGKTDTLIGGQMVIDPETGKFIDENKLLT